MDLKSLYHYTSADFAKKIISSAALKLSVYPKINDPFDMGKDIIYNPKDNGEELYRAICADMELQKRPAFSLLHTHPKEEAILKLMSIVNTNLAEWDFKSTVENTPFLCLSAAFNIPLMWGHYGDGCKGIVLEFGGDLIKNAEKIHYDEFEVLPSIINAEILIKAFLKGDKEEVKKFGINLLIKKHEVWRYEQEYRLICDPTLKPSKDGNRFLKFDIQNLKGIYFGFNANEYIIADFIQELKRLRIVHTKLFKMIRNPGYFHASPQEIKII